LGHEPSFQNITLCEYQLIEGGGWLWSRGTGYSVSTWRSTVMSGFSVYIHQPCLKNGNYKYDLSFTSLWLSLSTGDKHKNFASLAPLVSSIHPLLSRLIVTRKKYHNIHLIVETKKL
jgi:hypothetical protein